ncbi:MAG TPA: YicC family protein [Bacteroidales bacterium]|nr:YicC family protein [Bacteroidales bacterium]HRW97125.1 YicC family protein [Bacteroidales bacterium]
MIKSMTGYGKAESEIGDTRYTIEIKTLNSKQFDPVIRIPAFLKDKELDIRNLLMQKLERGKVEFVITIDETKISGAVFINRPLAKKYFDEIIGLQQDLGIETDHGLAFSALLRIPEILQPKSESADENLWEEISKLILLAIQHCDEGRREEGEKLRSEFTGRIGNILSFLEQITPFEEKRISSIREKFQKELQARFEADKIDPNRFEQELIYYIEKIDITEEKVRLKSHCDYFLQTIDKDESGGKKLAFIIQEVGREINTLGAKANDWNIQRLVVLMKDELEKIKEQLFNIL